MTVTQTAPLAQLDNADKRFGEVQALRGASLSVAAGEVVALLGPNGAGKTTAIALLAGLQRADAGRATLFGRDPRDRAARAQLGAMLQQTDLPDTLTVAEHVRLFSGYYADPRPLDETVRIAGLEHLASRRYGRLSGGEKRRVQFALAVCGRPRLLFVDEPTTGLDSTARASFWRSLRAMVADGVGVLLTTHYLEEADALADRVVLLHRGRVLAEGTPEGIKSRFATRRVRCRSRIADDVLGAWPEVDAVHRDGDRLDIATREPESLLRRLLAADAQLSQLEVVAPRLDDALDAITREAA